MLACLLECPCVRMSVCLRFFNVFSMFSCVPAYACMPGCHFIYPWMLLWLCVHAAACLLACLYVFVVCLQPPACFSILLFSRISAYLLVGKLECPVTVYPYAWMVFVDMPGFLHSWFLVWLYHPPSHSFMHACKYVYLNAHMVVYLCAVFLCSSC